MDFVRPVAAGLDHLAAVRAHMAALAPPTQRSTASTVAEPGTGRDGAPAEFSTLLGTAMSRSASATGRSLATVGAGVRADTSVTLSQMLGATTLPGVTPSMTTPNPTVVRPAVAASTSFGTAPDLGLAVTARPLDVEVGSGHGPRVHPIHGDVRMHHGVDMGAPAGTPIGAFAAGTVVEAGRRGGYGNLVVIDHGNGITSRYAHQSVLDVEVGQAVTAGQVVGRVGSTGASTGPHLHFEIRRDGASIDPAPYLSSLAPGRS